MSNAARSSSTGAALIKGSAVREFAIWYEARNGRRYAESVVARLPVELQDHVWADRQALGLVATDWYPSEIVHAILDAIGQDRTDEEMATLIREANEVTVRRLSRGLYQFLFRMVCSPGLYAKHVQRAWRMLHSTGTRKIVLGDGFADSTIEDWPGHHRWLCLVTMETMRAVFEAMGCREVRLERKECVHEGHRRCRAILHYLEPR